MLTILLFIQEGHSYIWRPNSVELHIASDRLISIAYYSMPLSLFYLVQRFKNIPFGSVFLLFTTFIVVCGTIHLIPIWLLWHPEYWSSGIINALIAGISVCTTLQLIYIIPKALKWTNPGKLKAINSQLQQEIAEVQQANINLRGSEQRYATLLAVAPVGIFRTDALGNCIYINERYCQITGLEPETAAGEGWVQGLYLDDRSKVSAEWYQSALENRPFQLEYRFQRPDGTVVWVYGQSAAEQDVNGQIIGYVGTVIDISAHKQAEIERRQAERFRLELKLLEDLFDTTLAGYWDWDIPNNAEYLSPGFKKMFGYEDHELPNSPDSWQRLIFPEDLPQVWDCFNCHVQSQGEIPFYNEVRYRHRNGSTVWVICSGQVIEWDSAGEPLRMIGFHIDISDRKRAEEQIQHYATQLEISNQELEAFTYSVSHDLRVPLRAISGFSTALLEDYGQTFDQNAKDYFERICRNVNKMSKLLDGLLSLSRVTRYEIRLLKINLSILVQELIEELQASDPERQVEFVIAPKVVVYTDITLMRVALTNLLQNAWKFTSHHPKARIEFGMIHQEGQPIYFIRDDGAGFDLAYAKTLFGVFQRLHSTSEFPGTGIGLATVQRVIYRHGGKIWAEAAVEEGATFYFTLPSQSSCQIPVHHPVSSRLAMVN